MKGSAVRIRASAFLSRKSLHIGISCCLGRRGEYITLNDVLVPACHPRVQSGSRSEERETALLSHLLKRPLRDHRVSPRPRRRNVRFAAGSRPSTNAIIGNGTDDASSGCSHTVVESADGPAVKAVGVDESPAHVRLCTHRAREQHECCEPEHRSRSAGPAGALVDPPSDLPPCAPQRQSSRSHSPRVAAALWEKPHVDPRQDRCGAHRFGDNWMLHELGERAPAGRRDPRPWCRGCIIAALGGRAARGGARARRGGDRGALRSDRRTRHRPP